MAAYFIYARSEITDVEVSKRYSELAVPQIHEFGGEVLVARGAVQPLEGDLNPQSVTILRSDTSMSRACGLPGAPRPVKVCGSRLKSSVSSSSEAAAAPSTTCSASPRESRKLPLQECNAEVLD